MEKKKKEDKTKGKASKAASLNIPIRKTKQKTSKVDILKTRLHALCLSDSTSESEDECPECGVVYGDDDGSTWIKCDTCNVWWDIPCTGVREPELPDSFSCPNCVS